MQMSTKATMACNVDSRVVILLSFCICIYFYSDKVNASEEAATSLLEFKRLVALDPLRVLDDWLPNSTHNHCHWKGVKCDRRGRVTKLDLYSKKIQGTISPSLANLSHLRYLDLCDNSFTGEIPSELGLLRDLQILYLCTNRLVGNIPDSLTGLSQLKLLALGENNLIGSIPQNIGLMSSIQTISLQTTNLSGYVPNSIGNLSSLEYLALHQTKIQGCLPKEIGRLKKLVSLFAFENPLLTGPLPESFPNMTSLEFVDLHQSNLSGQLPSQLGLLKRLKVLYLWGNRFTGSIPASLSNCSRLERLDFDYNRLRGGVPLELGKLPLFWKFTAKANKLVNHNSGTLSILSALSSCSHLSFLDLSFNHLSGRLPNKLPQNLSRISLKGNRISGNVPWQAFSELRFLYDLDLSYNFLSGGISPLVGQLGNLQRLALSNNRLQGTITPEIGKLSNMSDELSLSHNMLFGRIPDSLGNLRRLRRLYLDHNRFSGPIPSALGECSNLEMLDLSSNQLSGIIPPQVASLTNIQMHFNLSHNELHGQLPFEIGKMIHAQSIDVSANRINDHIPATLEGCEELQSLNLSFNHFNGQIPPSLGRLATVESMDISYNNVSGSVPSVLQDLTMLNSLNLSFNNLSGEIPKGGAFRKFTRLSFLGNPFLCGEWIGLPSCPYKHSHSNEKITILIATLFGALLVCIIIFVSTICVRRLLYQNTNLDASPMASKNGSREIEYSRLISYQEIHEATGGFSRGNLLGSSTLVSVYKGSLRDGTPVAIKILNSRNKEAFKLFQAECAALNKVRHRNLVEVIGVCYEERYKAIVMQWICNGSLEEALRRQNEQLTLKQMVRIVTDVAHGLEYLHHHCVIQIVHCDIKPSNILLDENMVAHVSDFGISRLLCATNSSDSLFSTLALRGSIGYIPPEYAVGGRVSVKGDVYSFGVMLLVMVTGRFPTDERLREEGCLQSWVEQSFPEKLEEILDSRLLKEMENKEYWQKCLSDLVQLGLTCSRQNPHHRPSMAEVSGFLEKILSNSTIFPNTKI